MAWPILSRRERRQQVRDDIAAHLPGADATVPNSVLAVLADAMASLTHDNDLHLDWLARMMMPDTAEGEFAERWGNIWLPDGRKAASFAVGQITVTGSSGASVPAGAELTATLVDATGAASTVTYTVTTGVTLAGASGVATISCATAGVIGNLDEGASLAFASALTGIDGAATVTAPGLAGGAEQESDTDFIARYVARIQEPPHGGARHDYVAWALEVPGVTRAWAAQEMGVGTVTVRMMLDDVRADAHGIPEAEDVALVAAYIDDVRPVTVGDCFVVAPTPQPLNLTITDLFGDSPEVRANIATELTEMLRARAVPGGIIYASWVVEAISAATGEDHHDVSVANVVPASAGHIIVPGTITYS